jgi:predicted transcriptional regulator of viral defense system
MSVIEFLEQYPVFTQEEFRQFLISRGTTNTNTQREILSYHLKKQHIIRIRRSLFARVPISAHSNAESLPVDPYLLVGRISQDAVIAYQSAFDFHGVSYSLHHQYLYMSEHSIRDFKFSDAEFVCLPFPKELLKQNATNFEVISADRQGMNIKVTSLERTIVDVLDRPNNTGGWEEIWQSAGHISILNLDKVIEYANLLNNATTIAKLGFFLEQFQQQFDVDEHILNYLETKKPSSTHYLERNKREPGKLLKRWNLVVPNYIIERAWEEPNEDF